MRHKVSELEGALLDSAVASAIGYRLHVGSGKDRAIWAYDGERFVGYITGTNFPQFRPSSCWQVGGPIIERERISTVWLTEIDDYADDPCATRSRWCAYLLGEEAWYIDARLTDAHGIGPTPLVAAMRAYVASKFGDEVELP